MLSKRTEEAKETIQKPEKEHEEEAAKDGADGGALARWRRHLGGKTILFGDR